MRVDPRAGKLPAASTLVNVPRLMTAYYSRQPDVSLPAQRVAFGTSGHRGSALDVSFNEHHILAITQAICDYRRQHAITGPLFLGADTHALSDSAWASALEVLAANGVNVMIDDRHGYTPTPVVSHAILTHNRARTSELADGIVVTPSHNPPRDGGFKYNPPNGGPADTQVTGWIQDRANTLLTDELRGVKRIPVRPRVPRRHHPWPRLHGLVHPRPGRSRGYGRAARHGAQPRRRSYGRRRRPVLGNDRGALPRPDHRRERRGGPHLPLHERRLGRKDPHGLLLALRHAAPHRASRIASTSHGRATPITTATGS